MAISTRKARMNGFLEGMVWMVDQEAENVHGDETGKLIMKNHATEIELLFNPRARAKATKAGK